MQSALQAIESTYFTLQSQVDTLSEACQTQQQRDALSAQYVLARQNYWACVNKAFHDDDPQVMSLTSLIDSANQQISNDVQEMDDITKTLTDITNVVTTGAQLASKVIAG
jgi:hypothetical protein